MTDEVKFLRDGLASMCQGDVEYVRMDWIRMAVQTILARADKATKDGTCLICQESYTEDFMHYHGKLKGRIV
jgi:hypothetical protein